MTDPLAICESRGVTSKPVHPRGGTKQDVTLERNLPVKCQDVGGECVFFSPHKSQRRALQTDQARETERNPKLDIGGGRGVWVGMSIWSGGPVRRRRDILGRAGGFLTCVQPRTGWLGCELGWSWDWTLGGALGWVRSGEQWTADSGVRTVARVVRERASRQASKQASKHREHERCESPASPPPSKQQEYVRSSSSSFKPRRPFEHGPVSEGNCVRGDLRRPSPSSAAMHQGLSEPKGGLSLAVASRNASPPSRLA